VTPPNYDWNAERVPNAALDNPSGLAVGNRKADGNREVAVVESVGVAYNAARLAA
jgi:hypothetical protein